MITIVFFNDIDSATMVAEQGLVIRQSLQQVIVESQATVCSNIAPGPEMIVDLIHRLAVSTPTTFFFIGLSRMHFSA
jgi:hypothetical protein